MTPPLRVLVIGNFTAARCGIAEFARYTVEGLRHAGAEVTGWDATYDRIYRDREAGLPTYLPEAIHTYDVIHLNWHPAALNTYGAGHFFWAKGDPAFPLVSVYLNDLPPWSGCPFEDRADIVVTSEPYDRSALVLPYPILDWIDPASFPPPAPRFTVGFTGVRGDGHPQIRGICEGRSWAINQATPGVWLPVEQEVARLAQSTVNVCWYHEGRGIAGAPAVCLASRRPLLINGSPMLAHLAGQASIYRSAAQDPAALEAALVRIEQDEVDGRLMVPSDQVYQDLGWAAAAVRLLACWRDAR